MKRLALACVIAAAACKAEPSSPPDEQRDVPKVVAPELELGTGVLALADDPFPLIAGARYTYVGEFQGKRFETVISVREHTVAGVHGFYFLEQRDESRRAFESDNVLISAAAFGLGMYRVANGVLMTNEVRWTDDLDAADPNGWMPLLRLPPQAGAVEVLEGYGGDLKMSVTVVGPAKVTVPAGTFDCIELKLEERFPTEALEGAVWLAPGVGVVQWLRTTGRVDSLVSYELGS